MEGLMRVYETCGNCKVKFENTDGVGIYCDSCWDEYDRLKESGEMDEEVETDDSL